MRDRTITQDTKYIITDPTTKIRVGDIWFDSLIALFLTNRGLFDSLCYKNSYGVALPKIIRTFFETLPKKVYKTKTLSQAIKQVTNSWRIYEIKYARIQKENENVKLVNGLLSSTEKGDIEWREVFNTLSSGIKKQKFSATYMDKVFTLSIISYKNVDGELKVNTELQYVNERKELVSCPNANNADIYKGILKNGVVKKEKSNPYLKKYNISEKKKEIRISHGDFVVRTNLFRCYHKEHLVEEIIGLLAIVTPLGKVIEEKIPCAYCSECNCFFMLTSEYKRISEKGILLCQLIDKEEYYQNGKSDKFKGASESLLMQNGYNVKANVGLTDIQRQIILKNIIDSHILTQHRIASYLDTFIAQKINLPQYKDAVQKWQKDKIFVMQYESDEKCSVAIRSIKK